MRAGKLRKGSSVVYRVMDERAVRSRAASRSWEFGYRTEMERIAKEVLVHVADAGKQLVLDLKFSPPT